MEHPLSLKEEVVHWAELLQSRCVELNTALIKANNLDERIELADWESFSSPARAVRLKLIPRIGTINGSDGAFSFSYHVHGTGITIQTTSGENISFEYFPQPESGPKPLLGLSSMQQFISSVKPGSPLCDNQLLATLLEELFQTKLVVRVHEKWFFEFYIK